MNPECSRWIGEYLRTQRVKRGLSEPFVAAAVGYRHGGTVRRIEQGALPLPFSKVDLFANVLGIEPERLLDVFRKMQTNASAASVHPAPDPLPKSLARKISRLSRSRKFWEQVKEANSAASDHKGTT